MHESHCAGGDGTGGGAGGGVGTGVVPFNWPLVTEPSERRLPTMSFNQHWLPLEGTHVQPTQPSVCWQRSQHSPSSLAVRGALSMLRPSLFIPGLHWQVSDVPH